MQDMIPKYPDDCSQAFVSPESPWWLSDEGKEIHRGRSVFAFLPHIDQIPLTVIPIGRNVKSLELSQFRLSEKALCILDEWLNWLIRGVLDHAAIGEDE